jgi:2-haloacid dehalogenase
MIDALIDRGHTPYRQIGERALSHVMDRCRIAYSQAEVQALVAAIERLAPFADVVPALERLRRGGYRLAILSNGDPDLLTAAGPHIGFAFDHVISVAAAGYFKPHTKTYARTAEIIAADRTAILFVANHAFDCIGAKPRPTACARPSSIGAGGRFPGRRTGRTWPDLAGPGRT